MMLSSSAWLVASLTLVFSQAGPSQDVEPDAVLAHAPADAQVVVYLKDPGALLRNEALLRLAASSAERLKQLSATWDEVFDGPALLAIRGGWGAPAAMGFVISTRFDGDDAALYDALNGRLLPALEALAGHPVLTVERESGLVVLRLREPPYLVLYLSVRDGVLYGNTHRPATTSVAEGRSIHDPFTEAADFQRLPRKDELAKGGADLLAYVNLRPLMPLAAAELEDTVPGASQTLGINVIQFAAVSAQWSASRVEAALTVAISDENVPALDLLASAERRFALHGRLPDDMLIVAGGAMDSASKLLDRTFGLVDEVAPEISAEYRSDLAEARRDFGFDPQHEFLANMVDEWGVGLGLTLDGQEPYGVFLARLANPDLFNAHLRSLVAKYKLPVETTVYDGVEIMARSDGGLPRFTFAVLDDYLAVTTRFEVLVQCIEAYRDQQTVAAAVAGLDRILPQAGTQMAYLNLSRFAQLALAEEEPQWAGAAPEAIAALAERRAWAGARVVREPGIVSLRVALNDDASPRAATVFFESIAASMVRARQLSKRVVSAANMKGVITGAIVASSEQNSVMPNKLSELVESGMITTDMLRSPYDGSGPQSAEEVGDRSFYLYRGGLDLRALKEPAHTVVLAERQIIGGEGANFGFADGHVEWIAEPQAGQMLEEFRRKLR